MYKSRVETFNQVRYFNRLIFVVYITRWWVKNKLQYSVWMPEQKYTSGRGRQNIILGMWRWLLHRWQVRWVHIPLEMGCLTMCISKLPFVLIFQLADHRDGGGEEAVLQNNSKTKGTNTLPLCYWNGETVIWSTSWTKCLTEKMLCTGMI